MHTTALNDDLVTEIAKIRAQFPSGRSAVLPVLHAVQRHMGHIPPEAEAQLACLLELPLAMIHEPVTFYFMFDQKVVGRYHIYTCGNLSCWLRGSETVLDYLSQTLGIREGETTSDGRFTLTVVECLGQCDHAPVMQINGHVYGNLTPARIDEILRTLP